MSEIVFARYEWGDMWMPKDCDPYGDQYCEWHKEQGFQSIAMSHTLRRRLPRVVGFIAEWFDRG